MHLGRLVSSWDTWREEVQQRWYEDRKSENLLNNKTSIHEKKGKKRRLRKKSGKNRQVNTHREARISCYILIPELEMQGDLMTGDKRVVDKAGLQSQSQTSR